MLWNYICTEKIIFSTYIVLLTAFIPYIRTCYSQSTIRICTLRTVDISVKYALRLAQEIYRSRDTDKKKKIKKSIKIKNDMLWIFCETFFAWCQTYIRNSFVNVCCSVALALFSSDFTSSHLINYLTCLRCGLIWHFVTPSACQVTCRFYLFKNYNAHPVLRHRRSIFMIRVTQEAVPSALLFSNAAVKRLWFGCPRWCI